MRDQQNLLDFPVSDRIFAVKVSATVIEMSPQIQEMLTTVSTTEKTNAVGAPWKPESESLADLKAQLALTFLEYQRGPSATIEDVEQMLDSLESQKMELMTWLGEACHAPAGSAPPVQPCLGQPRRHSSPNLQSLSEMAHNSPQLKPQEASGLLATRLSLGASLDDTLYATPQRLDEASPQQHVTKAAELARLGGGAMGEPQKLPVHHLPSELPQRLNNKLFGSAPADSRMRSGPPGVWQTKPQSKTDPVQSKPEPVSSPKSPPGVWLRGAVQQKAAEPDVWGQDWIERRISESSLASLCDAAYTASTASPGTASPHELHSELSSLEESDEDFQKCLPRTPPGVNMVRPPPGLEHVVPQFPQVPVVTFCGYAPEGPDRTANTKKPSGGKTRRRTKRRSSESEVSTLRLSL